jgi:radical SAM protein with 4Fe4S-binding SPASM domain
MFWSRKRVDIGIIIFELTDACNQSCRFCYNHFKGCNSEYKVEAPNFRMARRTLRRLLSEARVGQISLTGGEPTLLPRIHDIVLLARAKGANVALLTNGTLLTEDDIAIYKDLGLAAIQIPILSHRSERHDHITMLEGSWERAMRSAKSIVTQNPKWLTPVFILSRLNIDDIEPTLDLYASLGVKQIMLNRFNIGGLGRKYAEELNLSHEELRDAFSRANRKLVELGMYAHNGVCTPMCLLNPKEYSNISFSYCTTDLAMRPLTINYRGDVRFCNHSPRVMGNIHQEPLTTILQREAENKYFDTIPTPCDKCELWERCRGGCRAASEQLYGTFDRVDPILEIGKK